MTIAVNHHAGQGGFGGPLGLAFGVLMRVAGRRRDRMVVDLAGVGPDDHVVDVGCGSGGAAGLAARRAADVVGVDPAPLMLRLARLFVRNPSVRWVPGTAEDLPLPDASATVVWAVATVHHWPEVAGGLAEIRRVLVTGGRLLTVERDVPAGSEGPTRHGWTREQAESYAELCRAAGFVDVRVEHAGAGRWTSWAVHAGRP
ncbi:class I SAM-dependent methyltransferase [Nocardia sp. NPDC004068]|uniref:class I SAM-dependent methyltransferase n=1 Tax=Nocardia sp. NPDC004068 TaxID=3364303 RepID=UPI0036BC92EB